LERFLGKVEEVRKLGERIREQVREEHWMAEANREKLLGLF
jgi:hypothetical protein